MTDPTSTLNNGVEMPALGLDTNIRGGPEPGTITLETYGRPIPEA